MQVAEGRLAVHQASVLWSYRRHHVGTASGHDPARVHVPPSEQAVTTDELTPYEVRILEMIASGKTNPQIAIKLQTSPFTVKTQVAMLCRKLGARGRANAVYLALKKGVIK